MTSPKPKRRFLQFSLRTFFILLTVFAVCFGWAMHKAREQAKAVAWVKEMGGSVRYEYEVKEDGTLVPNPAPPGPGWLRAILGVDFLADIKWVGLNRTPVSDLTPLAGLRNLRWLDLGHTHASDLTPLARMKNLERLSLYRTPIKDLMPLAGLKNLQRLYLGSTQVTDLTALAGLKNLRWLNLDDTQVSQEQIEELQKALPNCAILQGTQVRDLTPLAESQAVQVLLIDGTQVKELTPLTQLKNLQRLELDRTQVNDVTPQAGLKALQLLSLDHTQVKDVMLLAGLKKLAFLNLNSTPVSKTQIEALQQALPNCHISWKSPDALDQ